MSNIIDASEWWNRPPPGNIPPEPPDMDTRITRLEVTAEYMQDNLRDIKHELQGIKDEAREIRRDARTDFRLLFGALIAVAIGLAGLMAKGFGWL